MNGQSSALRGHTNAKLFLNKYFAARFGQLCNLEYATSIMLVAYSPDLVILNGLCASAMGHLSFTPGHDSPCIVDPDLGRLQATMVDYHNLARLAHALPDQDLSGPLVAVPGDRSARTSHLLMLHASMIHSRKPLIGSTAGARGAQHTMEMVSILFDEGIGERPLTIGLINTLSPLSYSSEMLETLLVYPRTATQVLSVPEGWVSGDGLAHACGAGHTGPADFPTADGGGQLPLGRRRVA